MHQTKELIIGAFTGLALMMSATSQAMVVAEGPGDAGDLTGTAQVLPGGTTSVTGSIGVVGDADLFGFGWGGGAIALTIDGIGGTLGDPQLHLFDSAGMGIREDDDSGGSLDAQLNEVLAAGTYFIGLTAFDNDALSAGGLIFDDAFTGTGDPTGPGAGQPLSGWQGGGGTGTYTINFSSPTQAVVPEPGTLLLLGMGGLAGFLVRRRQRS